MLEPRSGGVVEHAENHIVNTSRPHRPGPPHRRPASPSGPPFTIARASRRSALPLAMTLYVRHPDLHAEGAALFTHLHDLDGPLFALRRSARGRRKAPVHRSGARRESLRRLFLERVARTSGATARSPRSARSAHAPDRVVVQDGGARWAASALAADGLATPLQGAGIRTAAPRPRRCRASCATTAAGDHRLPPSSPRSPPRPWRHLQGLPRRVSAYTHLYRPIAAPSHRGPQPGRLRLPDLPAAVLRDLDTLPVLLPRHAIEPGHLRHRQSYGDADAPCGAPAAEMRRTASHAGRAAQGRPAFLEHVTSPTAAARRRLLT